MDELLGLRIVVTRPRNQADEFATKLGAMSAEVIHFPVIRIVPLKDTSQLDAALRCFGHYDWAIFTSVNGVEAVWTRFHDLEVTPEIDAVKVAAIGPKTAQALERIGVRPAYVPDEYVAEAIVPGLGDLAGTKFLLARADIARPTLRDMLRAAGAQVDDVPCYRTVPEHPDPRAIQQIAAGAEILTFTSPSTVVYFVDLIQKQGLDPFRLPGNPAVACIGPITAAKAKELGFQVAIKPDRYTTEGLIGAIAAFPLKAEIR